MMQLRVLVDAGSIGIIRTAGEGNNVGYCNALAVTGAVRPQRVTRHIVSLQRQRLIDYREPLPSAAQSLASNLPALMRNNCELLTGTVTAEDTFEADACDEQVGGTRTTNEESVTLLVWGDIALALLKGTEIEKLAKVKREERTVATVIALIILFAICLLAGSMHSANRSNKLKREAAHQEAVEAYRLLNKADLTNEVHEIAAADRLIFPATGYVYYQGIGSLDTDLARGSVVFRLGRSEAAREVECELRMIPETDNALFGEVDLESRLGIPVTLTVLAATAQKLHYVATLNAEAENAAAPSG